MFTFKPEKYKVPYGSAKPFKPLVERTIIKNQISRQIDAGNSSVAIFNTINSINPPNMAVNYIVNN